MVVSSDGSASVLPLEVSVAPKPYKSIRCRIRSLTDTPEKVKSKMSIVQEMRDNMERRPSQSASWLSEEKVAAGEHMSSKAPGAGMTKSPIPQFVLRDGFEVPMFDSSRLGDMVAVGHGSQAIVYKAKIPKTKQLIAVKVLRAELAKKPEDRRAFEREVQLLARLIHPHINNVIGIDRVGVLPCAMLEWCQIDLSQALLLDSVGNNPKLRFDVIAEWPAYERVRIAFELASALRFLHSGTALSRGVIVLHRDVKPANTGIDANGKLKLLDFGLAVCLEPAACGAASTVARCQRSLSSRGSKADQRTTTDAASSNSSNDHQHHHTKTSLFLGGGPLGSISTSPPPTSSSNSSSFDTTNGNGNEFYFNCTRETGTRRYMAPEVCRGELYGASADVFSFAIFCWEIFGLKGRPFDDMSAQAHTDCVVNGTFRPKVPSQWHPVLKDACTRGWRRDKRLRPNMDELFRTLFDFYQRGTVGLPRDSLETAILSEEPHNNSADDDKMQDPLGELNELRAPTEPKKNNKKKTSLFCSCLKSK